MSEFAGTNPYKIHRTIEVTSVEHYSDKMTFAEVQNAENENDDIAVLLDGEEIDGEVKVTEVKVEHG